jgi:hypothetical protein
MKIFTDLRRSAEKTLLVLAMSQMLPAFSQPVRQSASSPIQLTSPSTPTVPSGTEYALGLQEGKLDAIGGRLDKIETNVDGLRTDVGRIDTIGGLVLLVITVIIGPIVVYKIQKKLDEPKTPLGTST